ncbi:MAG: TolB family protein [Acidimicrobiales bacterium]
MANGKVQPGRAGHLPDGLSVANTAAFAGHGDLAFISQGQLLVLDGATGKITDLGEAADVGLPPEFSPNGQWLAYDLGRGSEWLARADGSDAKRVALQGAPQWLPNDLLMVGDELSAISSTGVLRDAGSADGLAAWSANGHEYVSLGSGPTVTTGSTSQTPWRLAVASSPDGPRTTWYRTTITVDASGAHGNYITRVFVVPGHKGLLVEIDPDLDDDADGSPIYEIRSPGAPLVELGFMLAPEAGGTVSFGTNGTFALGAGPDRYAWMTKSVLVCQATDEHCSPVPAPKGTLSLDPAWSPNGKRLAFVEAPSSNIGNFFPVTVTHWYASHHLFVLNSATAGPLEIAGTQGASAPLWSRDGANLLYVSGNGLWLLPGLDQTPAEIGAPLLELPWPTYYGQVLWSDQFAWSAAQ